jgi:hypothetical protein
MISTTKNYSQEQNSDEMQLLTTCTPHSIASSLRLRCIATAKCICAVCHETLDTSIIGLASSSSPLTPLPRLPYPFPVPLELEGGPRSSNPYQKNYNYVKDFLYINGMIIMKFDVETRY